MIGLTNLYVNNVCSIMLNHKFLSVYPYDKFPINIKEKVPCSFIINLSNSKEPGSHFVCIYITKKNIEYMDSYGIQPFLPRIKKFIRNHQAGRKFKYNTHCIQNLKSVFCGFYCIAFLLSKDRKITMKKFQALFNDLEKNDHKVINFILQGKE